jgi:hypothetical protein
VIRKIKHVIVIQQETRSRNERSTPSRKNRARGRTIQVDRAVPEIHHTVTVALGKLQVTGPDEFSAGWSRFPARRGVGALAELAPRLSADRGGYGSRCVSAERGVRSAPRRSTRLIERRRRG